MFRTISIFPHNLINAHLPREMLAAPILRGRNRKVEWAHFHFVTFSSLLNRQTVYRAGFFGHWFVNNHAATSTEIQASFRA